MPLDHEPQLQAAFAELRHRMGEEAPPFGAMRNRALRTAEARPPAARRWFVEWRLPLAATVVAVVGLFGFWVLRTPQPAPPTGSEVVATQRVEELFSAIEHEVALTDFISSPDYATDVLLTHHHLPPIL